MNDPAPPAFYVLTPPGVAGVAVVGVYGCDAAAFVQKHCFTAHGAAVPTASRVALRSICDGPELLDRCLVVRTAADALELHLHGSPRIVADVCQLMLRSGARRAMASDLPVTELDRLFVSPARTAREAALRAASSPSVWLKVLDRWHTMQAQGDAFPASREAASIAEMGSVAALLETPPVVAICGAPNTGKSTLFNALLGYSRSIDSPAEGTTHDSIREPLPLRGFTVVLSDTPGYGGSDAVWADILTSEAARAAAGADLAVLLLSPDAVLQPEELAQFHRALLVSGKADASPRMAEGAALAVSGLRGDNLSLLCDHIADMLGIPAENSSISFPLPFGQSFREAVICFSTSPSIEALANCRMELYNCLDLLMTRA